MDKYISKSICTDFIVADANYFHTGGASVVSVDELPQEVIDEMTAIGGITEGGRIYGKTSHVEEFITEEYYRSTIADWATATGFRRGFV